MRFTKAQTTKIKTFNSKFGKCYFSNVVVKGVSYAAHHCKERNENWYIDRKGKLYNDSFEVVSLRIYK